MEIKKVVETILPGSRTISFGSRCKGSFDDDSDYDILVIANKELSIIEKRRYAARIRKELAVMGIAADVLVRTEQDVGFLHDKVGSVVREAVREGTTL